MLLGYAAFKAPASCQRRDNAFETVSAVDGPNEQKGVGAGKLKLRLSKPARVRRIASALGREIALTEPTARLLPN